MTMLHLEDIRPGSIVCVQTADAFLQGGNFDAPILVVNVPKGVPLTIRCVNRGSILFEMVDLVLQGDECHLSMTNEQPEGYAYFADFCFADMPDRPGAARRRVPPVAIPHIQAEINFVARTIPVPTGKKDIRV